MLENKAVEVKYNDFVEKMKLIDNLPGTYYELKEKYQGIEMIDLPDDNKLNYSIERFYNLNRQTFKKYRDDLEDIDLKTCSTDADGNILYDTLTSGKRAYKFTPENTIKRRELIEELMDNKNALVKTYFCTDLKLVKLMPEYIQSELDGLLWELPKVDLTE